MTLTLVRFTELTMEGDWIFKGQNKNVLVSTWSEDKDRVFEARSDGASLVVGLTDENVYTLKFKKGARINLDGSILAYEPSSATVER